MSDALYNDDKFKPSPRITDQGTLSFVLKWA